MSERTRALSAAPAHAERFLQTLDERPVAAAAEATAIREALGGRSAPAGTWSGTA